MDDKELYYRVARTVASCPRNRLPAVIEILEKGGMEVGADYLRSVGLDKPSLADKRKGMETKRWKPTTDKFIIEFREAYANGISMTALARKVGVNRTTLFRYLYADVIPKPAMKELIMAEINNCEDSEE